MARVESTVAWLTKYHGWVDNTSTRLHIIAVLSGLNHKDKQLILAGAYAYSNRISASYNVASNGMVK